MTRTCNLRILGHASIQTISSVHEADIFMFIWKNEAAITHEPLIGIEKDKKKSFLEASQRLVETLLSILFSTFCFDQHILHFVAPEYCLHYYYVEQQNLPRH